MGASAGTGVRSFAEGGSTSVPSGNSFNLATANQNFARGLVDPSSVTLDTSRPGLGTPQRQIYQAQYEDYGLGSTPQAQGRLASILNMGNYGNQMPTFTRPQMTPPPSGGFGGFPMQALSPQPAYRIPYNVAQDQQQRSGLGKIVTNNSLINRNQGQDPKLFGFGKSLIPPEQQAASLSSAITDQNLTEAQYDMMMNDPAKYLNYVQAVQAGNAPETISYQQKPITYMTAAQQKAYNDKMSRELDSLLKPITVFDVQDQGGS